MFRYGLLCRALDDALAPASRSPDDAAAMERAGHKPRLIAGSAANIKVTRPEDLSMAATLIAGPAQAVAVGHG